MCKNLWQAVNMYLVSVAIIRFHMGCFYFKAMMYLRWVCYRTRNNINCYYLCNTFTSTLVWYEHSCKYICIHTKSEPLINTFQLMIFEFFLSFVYHSKDIDDLIVRLEELKQQNHYGKICLFIISCENTYMHIFSTKYIRFFSCN